jgi:hypothetical protein
MNIIPRLHMAKQASSIAAELFTGDLLSRVNILTAR